MSNSYPTLVLGASPNPGRYSFLATQRLQENGVHVFPFGIRKGSINGLTIQNQWPRNQSFHTITLYVNPKIQEEYYERIIRTKPERVIFNPGTENEKFRQKLLDNKIDAVTGCTLVMLRTNQYKL